MGAEAKTVISDAAFFKRFMYATPRPSSGKAGAKITAAYRESIVNAVNSALRRINVAQVVEDKINSMSVEELEKGVMQVMKTELNMIVNLGALIGLVIGSINIFI